MGQQGSGGDTCIEIPDMGQGCAGATGSISTIVDGVVTPVVEGLTSTAAGQEIGGVSDFVVNANGSFTVVQNLGGGPDLRNMIPEPYGAGMGMVLSIGTDGTITRLADLAVWEEENNPDKDDPGSAVDSNPYGIALAPDGSYLVADAGGNDLLAVDANGNVSFVAGFLASFQPAPVDPTASPAPDPAASPQMIPMQAVPTSVTVGPDGAYYVGQLTGFPFPVGGASVWRVVPGEDPTVYASGFTNIMDLAFGPDGTLWVVEFAHNGLLSGDMTGGLLSVPAGGGEPTLVATDGLMAPGGVTVGADGTVYVSNGSVMPGGGSIVTLNQ